MKLELGLIKIEDIQFASESKIEGTTLFVDKEAVKNLVLEDEVLASCEVDIARPGESVRITPVKDVIEPRVEVDKGIEYKEKALKVSIICKGINHSSTARLYNSIGFDYCNKRCYDLAIKYRENALNIAKELNDEHLIGVYYNRIGRTYEAKGDYSNAKQNYLSSIGHLQEGDVDYIESVTKINSL